jgi:hypothetical protein
MSDTDGQAADLEAMVEMYGFLREEIAQSNRLQQRIVLGVATFVGLVFGLAFSGALADLESQSPVAFELVVTAVLPIVGAAAGIWLVEQSRVMMAGNYLQLVEHKLHRRSGEVVMSWENWLRRSDKRLPAGVGSPRDGEWNDPQDVYDVAYRAGYLLFFVGLGLLSDALYLVLVVLERVDPAALGGLDAVRLLWFLGWSALFLGVAYYASQVLSHGSQAIDRGVLKQWEEEAFGRE